MRKFKMVTKEVEEMVDILCCICDETCLIEQNVVDGVTYNSYAYARIGGDFSRFHEEGGHYHSMICQGCFEEQVTPFLEDISGKKYTYTGVGFTTILQ